MLPVPTFSFTISSIHDNTLLDCRIYHPTRWSLGESHLENPWKPRGAILAHPYTALGGSYDDGVVLCAVSEILKAGFVAGTFNFRGAGSSQGRSSWTGKPELVDYISFIGFFVYYLSGLRPPPSSNCHGDHHHPERISASNAPPSPPSSSEAAPPPPPPPPLGITLILGGYSYGSLLTTYLPPASTLLDRFTRASDTTPEARIRSQALDLAARWNQSAASVAANVDTPRDRGRSVGIPDPGRMSMGGEAYGSSERTSGESSGGKRFDLSIRQSLERSRRRFRSWRSVGDGPGLHSRPSTAGEKEGEEEGAASSIAHDDHDQDYNLPSLQQVCYLLISPLLPPISLFATMFSKPHDDHHNHQHHRHHDDHGNRSSHHTSTQLTPNLSSPPPLPSNPNPPPHTPSLSPSPSPSPSTLTTHPTLAIYGTQDFFSSHRKLRAWAENLAAQPQSLFCFREVPGAGHFWQEREGGVERELRQGIREWVVGIGVGS